jgi:2-haloacid dehalogenase
MELPADHEAAERKAGGGRTAESGIKALLFDVFGTVVDWRSGVIRDVTAVAHAAGADDDFDAGAFADAWRAGYGPAMDLVRHGELPWTRLDDLHRRTLDRLLGEFGLTGLGQEQQDWLNACWHRLDPWPDAVDGLQRLKQRFVVASLSNGNVSLLVDMAKRAGLPWDFVFSAELFRHYKPDPETYLGAVGLLDLSPHEVMLVAAHHEDLRAAASHGLATAFVSRRAEYGQAVLDQAVLDQAVLDQAVLDQAVLDQAAGDYTAMAADFGALADALGA